MAAGIVAILFVMTIYAINFVGARYSVGHGLTSLDLVALGRQRFSVPRALTLVLIVIGLILVTGSSFSVRGSVLAGDALLFLTGISWGLFTLFARVWEVRPLQSTAIISVLSMIYLPL